MHSADDKVAARFAEAKTSVTARLAASRTRLSDTCHPDSAHAACPEASLPTPSSCRSSAACRAIRQPHMPPQPACS